MIRLKNPKKIMLTSFVFLLFTLFTITPVVSALMIKISVEDLTREADVIIIGDIKEVESRWNPGRTMIYTYSTLYVEKYVKGGEEQKTLTIITEGGTVDDSSVWVEDVPIFTKNETVLVFLKQDEHGFTVVGWVQGKYIIENENVYDISGEKTSLEDFLHRIEDTPQDVVTPAAQAIPEAPGFGVILAVIGLLVVTMRRRKT